MFVTRNGLNNGYDGACVAQDASAMPSSAAASTSDSAASSAASAGPTTTPESSSAVGPAPAPSSEAPASAPSTAPEAEPAPAADPSSALAYDDCSGEEGLHGLLEDILAEIKCIQQEVKDLKAEL